VSTIDGIEIVTFEDKIYVPKSLQNRSIVWYHFFLNHPGEERLYKTMNKVCYWKGMSTQTLNFCQKCNECQLHKSRKRKYGQLPPKNVGELEPWKTVHTDLIGPYSINTKQFQTDGSIVEKEFHLTCMTIVDPATGWFEIVEIPHYIIKDIKKGTTHNTVDKSSARISRLFNQTWLSRYPRPKEVVFDNGSEFKKDFVPLLEDFAIKPKCTSIKNPQSNSPVERIHQVLTNIFRTKNLHEQIFDYFDPFGEILASVAWAV
jgi:transposase InsO family protein